MGTIVGWALALLGPAWAAARPWLPAAAALHRIGIGVLAAAALVAGVWLVWTLRDLSERDAVADKAQAIVDRANLKAENKALAAAARRHAETLAEREAAIAAGDKRILELEQQLKEKRDASPDPDKIVVPPGDPWLAGPARGGVRKRP